MKFILDENISQSTDKLPNNVINSRILFFQNGLDIGQKDDKLIELANTHDYIIITRDLQMILKQNKNQKNVVWGFGKDGTTFIPIPKNIRFKSRDKLYQYASKYVTEQTKDEDKK